MVLLSNSYGFTILHLGEANKSQATNHLLQIDHHKERGKPTKDAEL